MNPFRILRALFLNSQSWCDGVHADMDTATNDHDRHRIHAHAQIDARMQSGIISGEDAEIKRDEWDYRHGYGGDW